ncbi:mitochondrial ribonuclease P catalytic subunit [Ostrinia nubilalis]|uniref:mitochondrial ribonuclease P catalytic subunit n=1 Tax=Ostrinia nubilalis TaxID=29057 RepID=UPI0030823BCA
MFHSLSRLLLSSQNTGYRLSLRLLNTSTPITRGRYATDQIKYVKSVISSSKNLEWSTLKKDTLEIKGSINSQNIDAVFLKVMVNGRNFEAALSFAEYLKSSNAELNLGSINGLLVLFYEMGKENELSEEQKAFILESYKDLYNKYKVLDSTTCEKLIHALCVINEWKKALKVLEDIKLTSKPSHSAYSLIIASLFNVNKKSDALKIIARSVADDRPIQHTAYVAWINYIIRKYKDKKTITKYLEEINMNIFNNSVSISEQTAQLVQETYSNLNWNAQFTRIRKIDGECMCCNQQLDCLKLSEEEFQMLQQNIKQKLIVGSDLFLKTSPDELDRFLRFVNNTAPYDVVLDALNIAYIARNGNLDRVSVLSMVVNYFESQNKRMLLLGRKHMLGWPRKQMQQIMGKTCSFFTDDLSQDDPYFITAAILSGSHTDIVSKDLLRGHQFLLKDEQLRLVFRRWQWQHQCMVFLNKRRKLIVQPPLKFTPCAQKKNGAWHLVYEKPHETDSFGPQINDGTPDLTTWLCLRPPNASVNK